MNYRFFNKVCLLAGTTFLAVACSQPTPTEGLALQSMQGFPAEDAGFRQGVSALYAGVYNGQLWMAGGCNFPDIPVAEGGKKVYYDGVYTAPLPSDSVLTWTRVGCLPEAAAYGVTVSSEKGLICIGGNTASRALNQVFLLSLQNGEGSVNELASLRIDTLPSLPATVDNMAGACLGQTVYVVGGNVDGVPSSAVFALDMQALEQGWKQVTEVPGNPRVQPVCAASSGKLYVWGGFAAPGAGREASLNVDGYAYDPRTATWMAVATPCDETGTPVSLGGGMALAAGDGKILCAGGVNKDIFLKALKGEFAGPTYLSHPKEWYRFNRKVLLYDTATDTWQVLGDWEQGARAGAAFVTDGSAYYILNGELKPGIRTPQITRLKWR